MYKKSQTLHYLASVVIEFHFNLRGTKIQTSAKINPHKVSKFYSLCDNLFTLNLPCTEPPSPKVQGGKVYIYLRIFTST